MSVVAAAIIGSTAVGLYGADQASKAQVKASKAGMAAEERMAAENLAFQREMADAQREDFAPWREAGQQALSQIQEGIKTGAFDVGAVNVRADPGYQFRMDEGVKALDSSAAARGRLLSGAQQKGVNQYAQNLASQEYANAYSRQANDKARKFNMLSSLSSGGQASAAGQAQTTGQLAQASGNIMSNLGRTQNIAAQNQGAARAGAYQGGAQALNQAGQNWMMYNALKPATTTGG